MALLGALIAAGAMAPFDLMEVSRRARAELTALGWTRPLRLMSGGPRGPGWDYPEPVVDLGFRDDRGRTVSVTLRRRDGRIVRLSGTPMPENPKAGPNTTARLDRAWKRLADGRSWGKPSWRTPGMSASNGSVDVLVQGRIFFNVNPMMASTLHVDPADGRVTLFVAALPTPPLDATPAKMPPEAATMAALSQKTVDWRKPDWTPRASTTLGWFIQERWPKARPAYRVVVKWFQRQRGFPDPLQVHQDSWVIDAHSGQVLPAPHGVR